MDLAGGQDHDFTAPASLGRCPECDFSKVEAAFESAQAKNIPKAKAQLRDWLRRWRQTDEFAPWPTCATTAREFTAHWREAFWPLREWGSACASGGGAGRQRGYTPVRLAPAPSSFVWSNPLAGGLV